VGGKGDGVSTTKMEESEEKIRRNGQEKINPPGNNFGGERSNKTKYCALNWI